MSYQEYTLTRMPYGKYKGYFLKDLPDDYVIWCVKNFSDAGMATMMATELQRRRPKLRK